MFVLANPFIDAARRRLELRSWHVGSSKWFESCHFKCLKCVHTAHFTSNHFDNRTLNKKRIGRCLSYRLHRTIHHPAFVACDSRSSSLSMASGEDFAQSVQTRRESRPEPPYHVSTYQRKYWSVTISVLTLFHSPVDC